MPENKTIHDLSIAEQTSASDVFETEIPSSLMQSGYASRKVTMSSLESHILGAEQYNTQLPNFPQGSRSIFSALEYARQSGGGGGASANEALPYDATATYSIGNYCIENNYLWRCITAISTPEAFDATKWIAVLVTDEYKRVRVMHKADFDLLTPEEQADGMIFVDDVDITASDISYDNTASGLSASDLQDAVDEVSGKVDSFILSNSSTWTAINASVTAGDYYDTPADGLYILSLAAVDTRAAEWSINNMGIIANTTLQAMVSQNVYLKANTRIYTRNIAGQTYQVRGYWS